MGVSLATMTATATPTPTATAIASTDVSSPELTTLFATAFVVLGALLVLTRLRR